LKSQTVSLRLLAHAKALKSRCFKVGSLPFVKRVGYTTAMVKGQQTDRRTVEVRW